MPVKQILIIILIRHLYHFDYLNYDTIYTVSQYTYTLQYWYTVYCLINTYTQGF